jgi:hypothetical protein
VWLKPSSRTVSYPTEKLKIRGNSAASVVKFVALHGGR